MSTEASKDLLIRFTVDSTEAKRRLADLEAAAAKLGDGVEQASKKTRQFSEATKSIGSSGNMGYKLQQASYQISDFAVQVGGGTSAMRAFAQQAPQLFQGLGPMGAAIGVASALFGALAKQLFDARDAAADTKEELSAVTSALTDINAMAGGLDVDGAIDAFNKLDFVGKELALTILETRIQLSQLAAEKSAQEIADQVGSLNKVFGTFGEGLKSVYAQQNIQETFKLEGTTENITKVINTLRELEAKTISSAEASKRLREANVTGTRAWDDLTQAIGKNAIAQYQQNKQAADAEKLQTRLSDAVRSGTNARTDKKESSSAKGLSEYERMLKSVKEQLSSAQAIFDNHGESLSKLQEFEAKLAAGTLNLTAAQAENIRAILKREEAVRKAIQAEKDWLKEALEKAKQDEAETQNEANEVAALFKRAQALERSLIPLREYEERMKELMELKPYMSVEAFGVAMDNAREKLEKANAPLKETGDQFKELRDAIDGYAKDMAGAFVDAVSGAESFSDGFKKVTASVLKNLAQMILQKQVFDKMFGSSGSGGFMDKIVGSIGGWLGFAKGGAFGGATGLPHGIYNSPTFFGLPGSGPIKAYAHGGVLAEAGRPEAILPLMRNSSGDLGVASSPANVVVNNYTGQPVDVRNGEAGTIEITVGKIVDGIMGGGSRVSRALESTYGLSRQGS